MIGTKIGNYKVVEQIGEGGMGAVYSAKHTLLDKMVAVKVLLPEYCSNEEVVSRFFNEAKATTMVDHPGIVELYDFGNLEDGRAYIVMELLVGESLDDRIASRPLPYTEAARIASRIAGIMRAAHSHDIVHRDLKPENIILVPDPGVEERERPKVLDFGIAKLNDESGPEEKSKVKTRTGSIIGSPLYMSPEQCRGSGRVDYRSDIYSLGCILFELLCSRPPFDGEGTGEIIGAHLHVAPEHPSDLVPSVPKGLSDIVLKSLAKLPAERFQSMDEFARALRKYCTATAGTSTDISVSARPWGQESIDTPPPPSAHAATQLGQGPDRDGPVSGFGKTRTPMPTTLGLSTESGVAAPKPEGKNTVLTMLVVGAVAAAGLAYYQVSKAKDKAPATAARPEGMDTQAAPAPEAPVVQSEVTLRIESVPAGAAIHQASDDALLGHAPLDLKKTASEETLKLLLRHPGHEETSVDLSLQADDTKVVTLSATAAAEGSEEPVAAVATRSEKREAAKARAAARKLAKARAKAEVKARAETRAEARAKAKAEAKTKTKNSPLTQPKAKTKRAGDGALDPFNM